MVRKLIVRFFKQLAIFLVYLILASLVLFNHLGGADIIFIVLITVLSLLHLIVTIFMVVKKKWLPADLFALLLVFLLFYLCLDKYGELMWWITS